MKGMSNMSTRTRVQSGSAWPRCEHLEVECPVHALGRQLGVETLARLVSFVATTGRGGRLTLQRNNEGFTVQVTDAVEHARELRLTVDDARRLGGVLSGGGDIRK